MLEMPQWGEMFVPSHSLIEIVLRGTIMYVAIFLLLRVILKRQTGGLSTQDMLLTVLLADAAQNGMAGEYRSVTEGILLVATLIFWNYVVDWAGYTFPAVERFIRPRPLVLVENGRLNRRNMRREMITVDELMASLREQNADKLTDIKVAYMEADGEISVRKRS